jgi:hypothetical protein
MRKGTPVPSFRRGCVAPALVLGSLLLGACGSPLDTGPIVPSLPEVPRETVLLYDVFDDENGGAGVNNWSNFAHWTVVSGCVDLHGNGFFDVQAGNGLYVDLDGTCWQGGTIRSKTAFTLQPGSYVLEFWLAGNQRNEASDTVFISLGTLFNEQIVLGPLDPFRLFTRNINVTAATSAHLQFGNSGTDNQGALLDVVRLRRAG